MANKAQSKQGAGLPKPVKVVETGEVFPSRKKAADTLGCSTGTIYTAIKYGTPVMGFHLLDASDEQADDEQDSTLSVEELVDTVEREIESVFSRRSDNHFNDLEATLARRGISMDFTEGKDDLAFSKGGQTLTGTQMGRPLGDLIEASLKAGRPITADGLRHLTAKANLSLVGDQLEKKDRQIADLQATVTSLIRQLDAKEEKIGTLTSELSSLRKHIEHLDASLEYWQTAMRRCEEAADAKVVAVINQYKQQPRSRLDGIRRFLTPSADAAQSG